MFKSVRKVLFLILVSIGLSKAEIECYICNSSENPDCETLASVEPQKCTLNYAKELNEDWLKDLVGFNLFQTYADPDLPLACQKLTMLRDNKPPIVYRGCQLNDGKVDMCSVMEARSKNIPGLNVTCSTCSEDGCNKSTILHFSLWITLAFLIVLQLLY